MASPLSPKGASVKHIEQPQSDTAKMLGKQGFFYIPRKSWDAGQRMEPNAPFHIAGGRLSIIVPHGRYPHLTLDLGSQYFFKLHGIAKRNWVGIKVNQLHYSTALDGQRWAFHRQLGQNFRAESGQEDLSKLISEGNTWLNSAKLPLTLTGRVAHPVSLKPKLAGSFRSISLQTKEATESTKNKDEDSESKPEDVPQTALAASPGTENGDEGSKSEVEDVPQTALAVSQGREKYQGARRKSKGHGSSKTSKSSRGSKRGPRKKSKELSPSEAVVQIHPETRIVKTTPSVTWQSLFGCSLMEALDKEGAVQFPGLCVPDIEFVFETMGLSVSLNTEYSYLRKLKSNYPLHEPGKNQYDAFRSHVRQGRANPDKRRWAQSKFKSILEKQGNEINRLETIWNREESLTTPIPLHLAPKDMQKVVDQLYKPDRKAAWRLVTLLTIKYICGRSYMHAVALRDARASTASLLVLQMLEKIREDGISISDGLTRIREILKGEQPFSYSRQETSEKIAAYCLNEFGQRDMVALEKANDIHTLLFSVCKPLGELLMEFSRAQLGKLEQEMIPIMGHYKPRCSPGSDECSTDNIYLKISFFEMLLEKARRISEEPTVPDAEKKKR